MCPTVVFIAEPDRIERPLGLAHQGPSGKNGQLFSDGQNAGLHLCRRIDDRSGDKGRMYREPVDRLGSQQIETLHPIGMARMPRREGLADTRRAIAETDRTIQPAAFQKLGKTPVFQSFQEKGLDRSELLVTRSSSA
jgi:hypothetical protein